MNGLPRDISCVGVPPIKCQGIKTKLVPFIFRNIRWVESERARWIEPFFGSGVVALNLAPNRAILSDTNKHIIRFYQSIQKGEVTPSIVREYLISEGRKLEQKGEEYYYEVRERFNQKGYPLDFLFLNRASFNGLIRFNNKGEFNVPFCRKPERFSPAYITKIVNQVNWVARQMRDKDWQFLVASWEQVLELAIPEDFVYIDPPYIGRHTDYYNRWDEEDAIRLARAVKDLPCGFAVSMWLQNRYRRNLHVDMYWSGMEIRVYTHFYHVGATEALRHPMDEVLIIRPDYAAPARDSWRARTTASSTQLSLALGGEQR